jgi:hypothetical protein
MKAMHHRNPRSVSSRCWLQRGDRSRIQITPGGILIGRTTSCHILIPDRRMSKCHALVRVSVMGPELIPLGRNPTMLNGAPQHQPVLLHDQDRLGFPSEEMSLLVLGEPASCERIWVLEHRDGHTYGLLDEEIMLGGGVEDALQIIGWPPGAARLITLHGELLLMVMVEGQLNGESLSPMELPRICSGDTLTFAGESVRFLERSVASVQTTQVSSVPSPEVLTAIRFEFLPDGGELTLSIGGRRHQLKLSELRSRLLAILIAPAGDYAAGDFIPDEMVLNGVWPRQASKERSDINLLLYRLRVDLLKAGIVPHRLIERLKRGQATKLCIPPGCLVEMM